MKNYNSINAEELEKTLERLNRKIRNGHDLKFSIATKDGGVKSVTLNAGDEEVLIDGTYAVLAVSEIEKPSGWITTIEFTDKAREILDAEGSPTTSAFAIQGSGPGATEETSVIQAKTRAIAFLSDLESRYRKLLGLYEGQLDGEYTLTTNKAKMIDGILRPVDRNGKVIPPTEMPF